jgi:hypothetical protein
MHKWLHHAGFGVSSVTVSALIVTWNYIQCFLHSCYVDHFAKFFIGMGYGEMYTNVVFQYWHPQSAERCGRSTTPSEWQFMAQGATEDCDIAILLSLECVKPILSLVINFVLLFSHCYRVSSKVAFPVLTLLFTQVRTSSTACADTNALARGSWVAWLSPHENLFCF